MIRSGIHDRFLVDLILASYHVLRTDRNWRITSFCCILAGGELTRAIAPPVATLIVICS
jgi:hypothetical protein